MRQLLTLAFFIVAGQSFGQDNKEMALAKGKEAIKLMDNGHIAESIKLLEESMKLDPDNIDYPYEIGYAHYMNKDYQKTIDFLTPLTENKNVTDRVYQLLGNSYDNIGQRDKSIETYEAGLKNYRSQASYTLNWGECTWLQRNTTSQ